MEGTLHTDLVLSHALARVPVHYRFLDGLGNARVDGLHARFVIAKIKTLRGH